MNDAENKILDEFIALKGPLKTWGSIVDKTIMQLLHEEFGKTNQIKIQPEYRLKDTKSLVIKALYREKQYPDPIRNIEDKIGTRVVLLKSDDIGKVEEILLKHTEWNSRLDKSISNIIDTFPKEFDYLSSHIIVWPKEDNDKFDRAAIPLLTCEIQIRTLLQHAFAEVSHDSNYKGPYKNDKEIMRKLAKSMALMEATDDYFCDIFKLMTDESKKYANYLNELIRMYNKIGGQADKKTIDYKLTDSIFELLTFKDVPLPDVEAFVEKEKDDLRFIISQFPQLIFKEPVFILVAYFFRKHKSILREHWPLNDHALKEVFMAFGTSYDNY